MPKRLSFALTEVQRETLEAMRDHHPKPHMRERAAAVLKVADGQPARWVARHGLLQVHDDETVGGWVKGYVAHGLGALYIRAGRGRKPAFSPSAHDGGNSP